MENQNNTKTTIEKFKSDKYILILEGIVVGFFSGLVVSFFRIALEKADAFRIAIIQIAGEEGKNVFLLLSLMILSYIIVYICYKKVPLCSGSGIPQVKGELIGQVEQSWWQIIIAKLAGGICAIGAGLSLGREGPSIQLGAMVGKGFSKIFKKLRTEEKTLMTCGAGAGLAGAFSAPLAGVVFSLEELHKNFSTRILMTTMAAAVTSDFVVSYMFGLSPVFDLKVVEKLPLSKYWMVICLGVILGAFGVLYNKTTDIVQNLYEMVPWKSAKIAIPFLLSLTFIFIYPIVLGSGHSLVGRIGRDELLLLPLLILLVVKFLYSIICFGSGAPGGIFLPLLVMGAITGGLFNQFIGWAGGEESIYAANFVILGMAGYFSAIVRAPMTGVILISEMTGDLRNFLSLALVSLVAYLVADLLRGKPIYDQLLYRMLSKNHDYGTNKESRSKKVLMETDVYHGSPMDGQKIEKMLLPKGCLVVSVQREDAEIVPSGSTILKGGDKLILLCSESDSHTVTEKLDNICKKIRN